MFFGEAANSKDFESCSLSKKFQTAIVSCGLMYLINANNAVPSQAC